MEERIKVSSAGFYPPKLRDFLAKKHIRSPEPFYDTYMSKITREEIKKRGIGIPEEWRSKELLPDDVKNSRLIVVALSEQKEELLKLFPEAHSKVFTGREIAGFDKPLIHEDFSQLPFDKGFWDYCEENPIYVPKILAEIEESLIIALPNILEKLGMRGNSVHP